MKKIITLFSIFIITLVLSQDKANTDESRTKSVVYGSMARRPKLDVKGSPYYVDNFMKIKIGNTFERQGKYNAAEDEVEYLQDGTPYIMDRKLEYNPVVFQETNEKLLLTNYNLKGNKVEGYLFVIYQSDNLSIFERKAKKYVPESPASTPYDKDIPPKYVNLDNIYFIQKNKEEIVDIPLNKKKLSEMFPEKKELFNENFKSKNLDLSKPLELQKFISIFKN